MPSINAAEVKVMLAMIGKAENIGIKNEELAALMNDGSTANAMRQRVQKIKNKAKACLEGEEVTLSGAATGKAAATPKATPSKAIPKKRAAKEVAEEDDDEAATPSKKARSPVKKENGAANKEESESEATKSKATKSEATKSKASNDGFEE